ncbi:MAG TPA: hypothetical protein VL551_11555 [Actinospica sp.]|nr:hypothetical protein [Actinospica sp.]
MTASIATPHAVDAPLRVCIEGINGVGKTSAARAVAAQLGTRCRLLDELTDQPGDTLPGQVIAALSSEQDPFLRTGHPVAEALALFGLQVRKHEQLAQRDLAGVEVVLEDRGLDTVAVYQAAILCSQNPETSPEDVARHLLASGRPLLPPPDATILLIGDLAVCSQRFADRIGRQLDPADVQLLGQIDAVYREMAADDPARYTILDIADMSPDESASAVARVVGTLLEQREAVHA